MLTGKYSLAFNGIVMPDLQSQTSQEEGRRGIPLGLLTHGIEETTFLKTLVNIYQSTQCTIPEDLNPEKQMSF
jgi:hypothetical protein